MTKDISPVSTSPSADSLAASEHEAQFDRFDRVYTLKAGEYWRATRDVEDTDIQEGDVLLVKSVRYADDQAHNVVLHPHPGKGGYGNRLLVGDFVASFIHEPRGREIRREEVAAIQGQADAVRQDMIETQSNRQLLIQKAEEEFGSEVDEEIERKNRSDDVAEEDSAEKINLPAISSQELGRIELGSALTNGYSESEVTALKLVAQREHRLARVSQKWLAARSGEMATLLKKITPFYEEEAAAALAGTEEIQEYVADLHKGIESLYLYTGKGVEVRQIASGASAPYEEPLHIFQKKLLMDEELCLYADVTKEFDYSSQSEFFDVLKKDKGLIDQILPVQRGIVCMAVTRRMIDYGHPTLNVSKNAANHEVFLLLRDGENIYDITSPVESHLRGSRLFPTRDEIDALYKKRDSGFSGIDCSNVTFKDVTYTDSLEQHERAALHYRRFLILLAGLDAREQLLGEFYPAAEQPQFITQAFQNKYFRFVEDDSQSSMIGDSTSEQYPPVSQWIEEKNKCLASGSRVLCYWDGLITRESAPSCFRYESWKSSYSREYTADVESSIEVVARRGNDLVVQTGVSGKSVTWEDRSFNAKVNLSKYTYQHHEVMGFLCLDSVKIEEIDHYLYSRKERNWQLGYIRLFKVVRNYLLKQAAKEEAPRAKMREALVAGGLDKSCNVGEVIDTAIMTWRAHNRGAELPDFESKKGKKAWDNLLESMYRLANAASEEDVADFIKAKGRRLLRLVVDGKGKSRVYATLLPEERDDRTTPDQFVASFTLSGDKESGFVLGEMSKRLLQESPATENIQWQDDSVSEYIHKKPIWRRASDKAALFDVVSKRLDLNLGDLTRDWKELAKQYFESRSLMTQESRRYVIEPSITIPVGVGVKGKTPLYIVLHIFRAAVWLYQQAPNDVEKSWFMTRHASLYKDSESASEALEKQAALNSAGNLWVIGSAGSGFAPGHDVFSKTDLYYGYEDLFDGSWDTLDERASIVNSNSQVYINESIAGVSAEELASKLGGQVEFGKQSLWRLGIQPKEGSNDPKKHFYVSVPESDSDADVTGIVNALSEENSGHSWQASEYSSLDRVEQVMKSKRLELNQALTDKVGFPVWGPLPAEEVE